MTYLIDSSANRTFLVCCMVCVFLYGCASAPMKATNARELPPPLEVGVPSPDRAAPQAAGMATVRWTAAATGGLGKHAYEFRIHDGKEEKAVQSGPSRVWNWEPAKPGTYRVNVVVRDSIGNTVESDWSPEYLVVPKLVVSPLSPDKAAPQAAGMATVRWTAAAAGGVGKPTFEFRIHTGKGEKAEQKGSSPAWDWKPSNPGSYQVKVVVRDSIGNTAESGWSPEYLVVPKLVVSPLSPDKAAPQAAGMATVRWTAAATGGVGERFFEFRIFDGKEEKAAQSGTSGMLDWKPMEPGAYRVKAVVRDSIGNTVESGWSREYGIVPKLVVSSLTPGKAAPQAAEMATVRWTVEAAGGVGERFFEFRIFNGKEEKAAQSGTSGLLDWKPMEPGAYRVKAVVRDSIGNTVESGWSPEYLVVPKLVVSSLTPDKAAPQAAGMAAIRWKAESAGGVGERFFEFRLHDGKEEKAEQKSPLPVWDWKPMEPGTYRMKAVVRDAIGNTVESGWTQEYVVVPPMVVSLLPPDKAAPQAAEMATVRWKVEAAGGVGKHAFEFILHDGKGEKTEQKGPSPVWNWKPVEPGAYRVKAVVRDAIGNTVESGWSPEYLVVPKLVVSSLTPDKAAPQPAGMTAIHWSVEASGGVGKHTFEFRVIDGKEEKMVQGGPSALWEWSPRTVGTYRVKAIVRDSIGNTVAGAWSPDYEIGYPVEGKSLIAVMPMENLSGAAVPVKELRKSLGATLKARGLNVLEEDVLEKFMDRHRVRYAGGLTRGLGEAFQEETGTNAVLFLSIDQYDETAPPKIALSARLVSTGRKTVILWADGVEMAGNDAPGILGLGLILDSRALWEKARERMAKSLAGYLAGKKLPDGRAGTEGPGSPAGVRGKYRPKEFHRVPIKPAAGRETLRIAVLPFLNESTRKNAGEIMVLHFLRRLSDRENLEVIEPGEVRQALLMSRTILEGGLSLPQAELLHIVLDADLVLTGNIMDYEDYSGLGGNPNVNFSVRVLDMRTKRVTWTSISYNRGDDGVFFFNMGKVNTAHAVASAMAGAVVGMMQP